MSFDDHDRPKAATPEIDAEIVRILRGWQDTEAFARLHALVSTCVFTTLTTTAGGSIVPGDERSGAPSPDILRHEARDFLAVAWAFAYFIDALADRVEAKMN